VLKKINRLLKQIEPLIVDRHPDVTRQIVSTLVLFGWLHFCRTTETTSGLMDFAIQRRGQVVIDEQNKFSDEEMRWDAMLERYGFGSMDELDLAILDGIKAGYFNSSQMDQLSLRLDAAARNRDASTNLENAWSLFRNSLDNNADAVVGGILQAFKDGVNASSMANLDSTVRTFKELERPAEADEALTYFLEHKEGGANAFDLSSFAFRHNVHDPDVIRRLNERAVAARTLPSPDEVLQQISKTNSLSHPGLDVLSRLSVAEFVSLFRRNAGPLLQEFMAVLNDLNGMKLQDPRYAPMTTNAWAALEQLALESRLNEVRFASYYGYAPRYKQPAPEDEAS
jgi:hypothetical protein